MLITFFPFPNSSEIFPTYSTTQLHIFFLLKKKYGGGEHVHVTRYVWRSEGECVESSTVWVPGTKLRPAGLPAGALTILTVQLETHLRKWHEREETQLKGLDAQHQGGCRQPGLHGLPAERPWIR